MNEFWNKIWYGAYPRWIHQILKPLAFLFALMVRCRYWLYQRGWFKTHNCHVPVVIVGNINVGGAGKTPILLALAEFLKSEGFKPGIVSRGYHAQSNRRTPQIVTLASRATDVGDEPLLLAKRLRLPVVVCRNRVLAVQTLLQHFECDVILSDDGLQHYALGRDIELCVVDGARHWGNAQMLPVGPLRESIERLKQIDFILSTDGDLMPKVYPIRIEPSEYVYHVKEHERSQLLEHFKNTTVHAVAGIADPKKFFNTLAQAGIHMSI